MSQQLQNQVHFFEFKSELQQTVNKKRHNNVPCWVFK